MPKRSLSFVSPYNKYIYLMGIESKTIQYLLDNDISIATAESCTGGLLAAKLTAQPGISQIYQSGFITYSNEAKIKHLKVSVSTLKKHGAVSRQVCAQMCFNLQKITKSQITFSTTGVAGPGGGTKLKPVGLVYVGVCYQKNIYVEQLKFKSTLSRIQIQRQTVRECFQMASDIIHGL
jgi:PncC family amidohydrolase